MPFADLVQVIGGGRGGDVMIISVADSTGWSAKAREGLKGEGAGGLLPASLKVLYKVKALQNAITDRPINNAKSICE